jgi:hypothetical protein
VQQIQPRRGTSAQWTSANPVLADGELGYETDTKKTKRGDGVTAWTGLTYSLTEVAAGAAIDSHLGGDATNLVVTVAGKVAKGDLVLNVKDYGAVGDGTTDDTTAIQNAINAAQDYVTANNADRFGPGVTVYFPSGWYKITSGLTVGASCITLAGSSAAGSVITAPNANFTLLTFTNATLSLYNCGLRDLRFTTPGNATAGYAVTVQRSIYFLADNLLLNGTYGGINLDGVAKLMLSHVIISQETRTAGTNAESIRLSSSTGLSGDVHLTDVQIMQDVATQATNAFIVTAVDGLYVSNLHMHGGLSIAPSNTGNETTVASVSFVNCYFDGSAGDCVGLTGSASTAYRNIRFTACYFRAAALIGLRVETSTLLQYLTVSGCRFGGNTRNGIDMRTASAANTVITGCTFDGNNTGAGGWGDVQLHGSSPSLVGCTFNGGSSSNGYAVAINAAATNILLSALNLTASSAPSKITTNNTNPLVRGTLGWKTKNRGSTAIGSGVTSVTVSHGLNVTPTVEAFSLSPYSNAPASWVSGVTATQFTINLASAAASAFTMGWSVDMEF